MAAQSFEELDLEDLDSVVGGRSEVTSQNIGFGWSTGFTHSYTVQSEALPPGISREQANDLLQRYNAPTEGVLTGNGNDPTSTHGYVVDPLTGHIPVGEVTLQHGDGTSVNATTDLHPFIGTVTRDLHENGDGTFSVTTTGVGEGFNHSAAMVSPLLAIAASPFQHAINSVTGPMIFQQVDDRMQAAAHALYGLGEGHDATSGMNLLSNGTDLGAKTVGDYVAERTAAGESVNILPGLIVDGSHSHDVPTGETPAPYNPFQVFAPTPEGVSFDHPATPPATENHETPAPMENHDTPAPVENHETPAPTYGSYETPATPSYETPSTPSYEAPPTPSYEAPSTAAPMDSSFSNPTMADYSNSVVTTSSDNSSYGGGDSGGGGYSGGSGE